MINEKNALKLVKKTSLAKDDLSSLKEFLENCSYQYYNTESPIIDDTTYDYIYNRYIKFGGEEIVGAEPPSDVVSEQHNYPLLVGTTFKAHNVHEFDDWIEGVFKKLKLKDTDTLELYSSLKFDGNSIVVEYDEKGNPIRGLTRGKYGKGKDVTKAVSDLSFKNPFKKKMAIKYEAMIRYSLLDQLNESSEKQYKNPRNTISGLINSDYSEEYKPYYLFQPLWTEMEGDDQLSREEELNFFQEAYENYDDNESVSEFGIDILNNGYTIKGNLEEIKENIREVHDIYISERDSYDFMIDGMVIDVVDKKYRNKLGYTDGGPNLKPHWCIALKFPYQTAITTVESIDFSMGDGGKITPVCYFKPVKFSGNTHVKQSLQNYKRFKELGLAVGSKIEVGLHNDTLTYIDRVDMKDVKKEAKKAIKFIKTCPVCGEPLSIVTNDDGEETFVYCLNDFCDGRAVGRMNNYLTKMDIKGIKTNTIQKLYDANLCHDIIDLYTFSNVDGYKVEGLGRGIIDKLVKALNAKKMIDYEILGSLGIMNFGLDVAKTVCKDYKLTELCSMADEMDKEEFLDTMCSIEGIAKILAEHLYEALNKERNIELIDFLYEDIGNVKAYKDTLNYDDNRYTIVVTGDLNYWTDRGQLKLDLESRGHRLTSSVSNKTDFLVTNDATTGTTKLKKAEALGKPIISEEEMIEKLHLQDFIK